IRDSPALRLRGRRHDRLPENRNICADISEGACYRPAGQTHSRKEPGGPMRTARPARRLLPLVLVVALLAGALVVASASSGAAQVPGFDGSTIKVGGLGLESLPTVPTGAKARFQEFNDNNELKGVKIDFVDYGNDGGDPATALSESRRLVTQEG